MSGRVSWGDEEGSILPLVFAFGLLALVVVLLVADATSLYVERSRLFAVADGAARAGSEAFDLDATAPGDGPAHPLLRDKDVRAAAETFLRDAPPDGVDGLRLVSAVSEDGRGATVRIAAVWQVPVVSLFVPAQLPIEVTSNARSIFH